MNRFGEVFAMFVSIIIIFILVVLLMWGFYTETNYTEEDIFMESCMRTYRSYQYCRERVSRWNESE